MDEFTLRHLTEYAEQAIDFAPEREAFIAWVAALSPDDLTYYTDNVGWPPALRHFRESVVREIMGPDVQFRYSNQGRTNP